MNQTSYKDIQGVREMTGDVVQVAALETGHSSALVKGFASACNKNSTWQNLRNLSGAVLVGSRLMLSRSLLGGAEELPGV